MEWEKVFYWSLGKSGEARVAIFKTSSQKQQRFEQLFFLPVAKARTHPMLAHQKCVAVGCACVCVCARVCVCVCVAGGCVSVCVNMACTSDSIHCIVNVQCAIMMMIFLLWSIFQTTSRIPRFSFFSGKQRNR